MTAALRALVDKAMRSDTPFDLFASEVMSVAAIPTEMQPVYLDSLKKAIDHYEGRPNDLSPTLAGIPDLNAAIVEFTNGAIDANEALWFTDTLDTMVGIQLGDIPFDEAFPEIEEDDAMKTDENGFLDPFDDDPDELVQLPPEGESLYGKLVPKSQVPEPPPVGHYRLEDIIQTSGRGNNMVAVSETRHIDPSNPDVGAMHSFIEKANARDREIAEMMAPNTGSLNIVVDADG